MGHANAPQLTGKVVTKKGEGDRWLLNLLDDPGKTVTPPGFFFFHLQLLLVNGLADDFKEKGEYGGCYFSQAPVALREKDARHK